MVTFVEFEQGKGDIVFTGFVQDESDINGFSRKKVAAAIADRAKEPFKINQANAPLCGPAAFMYCVASHDPEAYKQYVVDLLTTGEGRLGGLHVKPGADCRRANLPKTSGFINPVDWVALASLRDSSNQFLDMNSVASSAAGITLPSQMEEWFNATGWFTGGGVCNDTNLVISKGLNNLLNASALYKCGEFVCLFIVAQILNGPGIEKVLMPGVPKTVPGTPNHWVVLDSSVTIDNQPAPFPGCSSLNLSAPPPNSTAKNAPNSLPPVPATASAEELKTKRVTFNIYTWGERHRPVTRKYPDLILGAFLHCYYGFVSAGR
ncbi:MAG: hypothetical protein LBG78_00505 [Azoarcus sp.]|jgi:hypothetical protein|nr:hypothetical protein [Azoarcus sp.]